MDDQNDSEVVTSFDGTAYSTEFVNWILDLSKAESEAVFDGDDQIEALDEYLNGQPAGEAQLLRPL